MINGKVLYSTKGAAMEYGRIGCNFYTGCPHECTYCYLKRGAPSKQLGGNEVKLKKCLEATDTAHEIFKKELDKWQAECQEHGIFLSFTTDPLIPETRWMTAFAIMRATSKQIPVTILTKDATFFYDDVFCECLKMMHDCQLVKRFAAFGFTLTGHDEMEPHASSNADRLRAMEELRWMGFYTWASIEPVIDWPSSIDMVRKSIEHCYHYKIGLRSGVKKDYYNLNETWSSLNILKSIILEAGKTVYFKESVRNYLTKNGMQSNDISDLLRGTVDMDENIIQ